MGSDEPFSKYISSIHTILHGWILWRFHYILNILERGVSITSNQ